MFGLTPEDSLRALEDREIYENMLASQRARDNATSTVRQLRERQDTVARLNTELVDVWEDRNWFAAMQTTANQTLDHVIRDFARAVGVSENELRKRYNVVKTQYCNRVVNDYMAKQWLKTDPRMALPDSVKEWYVPGLDPDHGF